MFFGAKRVQKGMCSDKNARLAIFLHKTIHKKCLELVHAPRGRARQGMPRGFRPPSRPAAMDNRAMPGPRTYPHPSPSRPTRAPVNRPAQPPRLLLLLTNDGRLQARVADPRHKMTKVYWVQVEGQVSEEAVDKLKRGVQLKDGPAQAVDAAAIEAPLLWDRQPPIRVRQSIPTSWLRIALREGRNRQVRRMTAAVGLPTLRLVRVAIGPWQLDGLQPGQWRELDLP